MTRSRRMTCSRDRPPSCRLVSMRPMGTSMLARAIRIVAASRSLHTGESSCRTSVVYSSSDIGAVGGVAAESGDGAGTGASGDCCSRMTRSRVIMSKLIVVA